MEREVAIGATVRLALALLFLAVGTCIIVYNVRETIDNPELGAKHVLLTHIELAREIEGISNPTKQEMINLTMGDGMRFFAFLRDHLPEDTFLIFPRDEIGYLQPTEYLRMGFGAISATLHPRKIQTEFYEFQDLPYDPLRLSDVPQDYQLITWDYAWRSLHFVFRLFVSAETKRYRFFFDAYPVKDQPGYHTENLFIMYPEVPET